MELLVPYWEEAGYEVNLEEDKPWLIELTNLIRENLKRLSDAIEESRLLFGSSIEFNSEAITQLQQPGVVALLKTILANIPAELTLAATQELITTATKTHNVKKGVVMKSLRAALMGSLQGHDLIGSWLLLNSKGWDKPRLESALAQVSL